MYILDEPSIGLHQRDNERLLGTLKRLRDLGNTVIVVEHDEDAIRAADHVVDLGSRRRRARRRASSPRARRPQIEADPGFADRRLPAAAASAFRCRPARRAASARSMDHDSRRPRQQPARHHRRIAGRHADLRDRRVRLGQVDAGRRHPVPPRGGAPQRRQRRRRRPLRRHRRARALRARDRDRPEPDRPHAALQSCHLYRPVRACARAIRRRCPKRVRAATMPGASASTSRAAAAKPARAMV